MSSRLQPILTRRRVRTPQGLVTQKSVIEIWDLSREQIAHQMRDGEWFGMSDYDPYHEVLDMRRDGLVELDPDHPNRVSSMWVSLRARLTESGKEFARGINPKEPDHD